MFVTYLIYIYTYLLHVCVCTYINMAIFVISLKSTNKFCSEYVKNAHKNGWKSQEFQKLFANQKAHKKVFNIKLLEYATITTMSYQSFTEMYKISLTILSMKMRSDQNSLDLLVGV